MVQQFCFFDAEELILIGNIMFHDFLDYSFWLQCLVEVNWLLFFFLADKLFSRVNFMFDDCLNCCFISGCAV